MALLRGVNVGGVRVPMAELKELLAREGLAEARTHLQSGNVVVTPAAGGPDRVGKMVEKAIRDGMGLTVRVIVRTRKEMADIVANQPFPGRGIDPKMVHVIFFESAPSTNRIGALDQGRSPEDEFSVSGREIYVHYGPAGSGRSKLGLAYFEKVLGVVGTARNWNTVTRLREMLEE